MPDGFTRRDGVASDFLNTAKGFDFDLPPGCSFPKHLPKPENEPGTIYEHGVGAIQAYFRWEASMISAAVTAHFVGREAEAHTYIEALIEGTKSLLYRTYVVEGEEDGWAARVARPALERGDYSAMLAQLAKARELIGFADMARDAGHLIRR